MSAGLKDNIAPDAAGWSGGLEAAVAWLAPWLERALEAEAPRIPFDVAEPEARALLADLRDPGPAPPPRAMPQGLDPRLDRVIALHRLDELERLLLLAIIAPEVAHQMPRVFAHLNREPDATRPTAGLLARLFGGGPQERLRILALLAPAGPWENARIILPVRSDRPLSQRGLIPDPGLLGFLLGLDGLDPELARFCRIGRALPAIWARDHAERAAATLADGRARPLVVLDAGPADALSIAGEVARRRDERLVIADLAALPEGAEAVIAVERLVRESWLAPMTLLLEGMAALDRLAPSAADAVTRRLGLISGPCLAHLSGGAGLLGQPWPSGTVDIVVARGDPQVSAVAWQAAAVAMNLGLPEGAAEALAANLRLLPCEIAATVATTAVQDRLVAGDDIDPGRLRQVARQSTGHALEALATRIVPRRGREDLILPPQAMAALEDLVLIAGGLRLLRRGGEARDDETLGAAALFTGAPGTGKSMAAEIIAGRLGLDLFRIDLARMVDKYIGETEKRLDRLFLAAEDAQAVLLFDEADALFGKRSEVGDAKDRYANLEVAYLLDRIQRFDGLAILSTNLLGNIDDAFLRRFKAIVHFPFPGPGERARMWSVCMPRTASLSPDVDLRSLAERHALSGGHIRAAAVAAAVFAAARGAEAVGPADLERAVAREYAKLGRPGAQG